MGSYDVAGEEMALAFVLHYDGDDEDDFEARVYLLQRWVEPSALCGMPQWMQC